MQEFSVKSTLTPVLQEAVFMKVRAVFFVAVITLLSFPRVMFAGTITVSPATPSPNDRITITVLPNVSSGDDSEYCEDNVFSTANSITIVSIPGPCQPETATRATNLFVVGPLPAGSYQITWVDGFFNHTVASTTFTVGAGLGRGTFEAPTVSAAAMIFLTFFLALLGLRRAKYPD